MNINNNIKNFRIFRSIKQQDLADKLGKSKSVISNWERGANSPDVESCEALCRILKVTPNQLFGWEPNSEYEHWRSRIEHNNMRIDDLKSQVAKINKEIQALEFEQTRLQMVDDSSDDSVVKKPLAGYDKMRALNIRVNQNKKED